MSELKIFETKENETVIYPNGTKATISCICDDDGTFEILIVGNGGLETAVKASERVKVLLNEN